MAHIRIHYAEGEKVPEWYAQADEGPTLPEEEEADVLKLEEDHTEAEKKKEEEEKKAKTVEKVPYSQLFRYATTTDKLLILLGALGAAANGAVFPAMSLIFGELMDALFTEVGLTRWRFRGAFVKPHD